MQNNEESQDSLNTAIATFTKCYNENVTIIDRPTGCAINTSIDAGAMLISVLTRLNNFAAALQGQVGKPSDNNGNLTTTLNATKAAVQAVINGWDGMPSDLKAKLKTSIDEANAGDVVSKAETAQLLAASALARSDRTKNTDVNTSYIDLRNAVAGLKEASNAASDFDGKIDNINKQVQSLTTYFAEKPKEADEARKNLVNNALQAVLVTKSKSSGSKIMAEGGVVTFTIGGGPGPTYRSAIQENIVMAADRRCEIFKIVLIQAQSQSKFLTSTISALSGITGGLVGNTAARYFAGVSGGSAALNSSFENSFFDGQIGNLLIYGLDRARGDMRTNVLDAKRSLPLSQYTLQEAIGHALQYNGQCSVATALHVVQDKLIAQPDIDGPLKTKQVADYRSRCVQKATYVNEDPTAQQKAFANCETAAQQYAKAIGVVEATTPTSQTPAPPIK